MLPLTTLAAAWIVPAPRTTATPARARPALCSAEPPRVLCVGECLFDALPSGIFLGGAPLNVACHLAELGAQASFASAVGDDRLGLEVLRRLSGRGVDVSLVRTAEAETGFVTAEIDNKGDATYTFATPAAWDQVPADGIAAAAAEADAVVFGTLAQRSSSTRAAVAAASGAARFSVLDVNLRPPYDSAEVVGPAVAGGVSLLKVPFPRSRHSSRPSPSGGALPPHHHLPSLWCRT